MATLVFSALGTLLGGPIGGAIGALAGRQVDALIFAPAARQGPRLNELSLSASSYGLAIPRQHGRVRTGGQVIWATALSEQQNRQGGGKGRPATVSYAYSASFAVAISSRPIADIGRIWADGKLLRGAAGDLKTGGSLRVHTGHGDQLPDPLLAAAEGAQSPAYRSLAYVVFEDLQLAEYGNRIPTLSFEVIADFGAISLQDMIGPVIADCDASLSLNGLEGFSVDGNAAELLSQLDPLYPLDCDACDGQLVIRPERMQAQPVALPAPAVTSAPEEFGHQAGYARHRALATDNPPSVLRYYDPDRDYQPGVQRAQRVAARGQPRVIELPATIAADAARSLIDQAAQRGAWARHRLAWRVSQLDPAVRPGSLVTLPGEAGQWRVRTWEWRAEGVELQLERVAPGSSEAAAATDPGRVGRDPDLLPGPTSLVAFELPWDGNPATSLPQIFAAVGGDAGWRGASLLVDQGDGALQPAGTSGRSAVLGSSIATLPPASPLLFDRNSTVTVRLADPATTLVDATMRQLAQGANRALLGDELIQFTTAEPLEPGQWALSGLLRGRGGTEHAVEGHSAGEPFVLLDSALMSLDPAIVGAAEHATIAALGLADPAPVLASLRLAGAGWRPLSPVHGRAVLRSDGAVELRWVRRLRGGWNWNEAIGDPLNEQREAYVIAFGEAGTVLARWDSTMPQLTVPTAEWSALQAVAPSGVFSVRQVGDRALSLPLSIRPQ